METTTDTQTHTGMNAEPRDEHRWLQQMVGEWTYEGESMMAPDQPPVKHQGTETVRAIGDYWVQGDGRGEMPGGGSMQMQFTFGFDPDKRRFVGTFIASVMPTLWIYEGGLESDGKSLALLADGPNMSDPGRTAKYKDVIEVRSRDHRVLSSHIQAEDGTWQRFMVAHYRRTK